MKHALVIVVLLITTSAIGQSIQDQRACQQQAADYVKNMSTPDTDYTHDVVGVRIVGTHCYVRLMGSFTNGDVAYDAVYDAFTGDEFAAWTSKNYFVDKRVCLKCSLDHSRFNTLLYSRLPVFEPR